MGFIIYDKNNILKVNINIIPDKKISPDELPKLSYSKNEYLYSELYANSGKTTYILDGKLDKNNLFSYINFKGNNSSDYQDFNFKLSLKDKKINGYIQINNSVYDWQTRKYKKHNSFNVSIDGTTGYKNKISTLNIDTTGINLKDNKKFLVSDLRYNGGDFSFNNYINNTFINTDMESSGNWDSINKVLTKGDLNISVKSTKDKTTYTELLNINLGLKNKIITGKTIIKDFNKDIATIYTSGKYEKNYFKLNNYIKIVENPFNSIDGYAKDARNSKRKSDLGSIKSLISLRTYEGYKLTDMINRENLNYNVLNINRNYFIDYLDYLIDPLDNSYYKIKIDGNTFQLLAKLEEQNGDRTAFITGTSDKNLFIIDGKEVKNGDILEKILLKLRKIR